jgi:two-component system OmpR family sensor kinase
MKRLRQHPYLLPLLLGLLGIVLLVRVLVVDAYILLPESTDVIFLIAALSIGMVLAIHILVRVSISYLRHLTIQRVRNDTLSEHRRFLQRLDHELKNPLTVLRAGLKTLTITNLNEQQQSLVSTMETEVLRLSRLVTDLRKITELETQPLSLQPTSIEDVFRDILEPEKTNFEVRQRKFQYTLSFSRKIWHVDEDLLTLVLYNLLDNAYKYTHPNDTVTVRIHGHQDLRIEIQDTGVGISPESLTHVWEELYRASHIAHIAGSGIGLALVRAIVERHQGTVTIESELEVGTTICIQIPFIPHS